MQIDEKLRVTYGKMLAGISERAVSVIDLDKFLRSSLQPSVDRLYSSENEIEN